MSKPEVTFKVGAIRASIFRNEIQRGPQTVSIGKVVLEVRYRDKDGLWKSTHSMSANEVPKAILALQQAYEYMMTKKSDETQGDSDDAESNLRERVPVEKVG